MSQDRSSLRNSSWRVSLRSMRLERLFPLEHHQPSTMVTGEQRITLLYQVIVKIAPEFSQWTMARKDFSTVVRNSVSVVLTVVGGLWLAWLTAAPARAQNREPA